MRIRAEIKNQLYHKPNNTKPYSVNCTIPNCTMTIEHIQPKRSLQHCTNRNIDRTK